jgi:hypothetical protein
MDKQRKHIKFVEESHQYLNVETGEQYLSTTEFLSRYYRKFDASAIARKLVTTNKQYKNKYQGIEVEDAINELKAEWQLRTDLGNEIHNIFETHLINRLTGKKSISNLYTKIFDSFNLLNKYPNHKVCPEMILFSDKYKIAGQADLPLFNEEQEAFKIFDYKSNQKGIKKYAYQDQKMFAPLEHIPDSNYYHYALQLTLYAYMVREETGYRCDELSILWVDTEELIMREYEVGSHTGDIAQILSERLKEINSLAIV